MANFLNHSIIAHRGIYNNITIYENTIESVMYAVRNNLTVEVDIQITKDNKIIVFHDEDMSRMMRLKDKLETITLEDLEYISNYHIPTLQEVLDNVGGKVPILLDIKIDNKIVRNKLLEILKFYKGDIAIQSNHCDLIKFFKKKKYVVGYLVSNRKAITDLNKISDIDFLSIKYDIFDKIECSRLKQKYYLIGWTLNNREDVNKYIKFYNNLIIDNIEEVFK